MGDKETRKEQRAKLKQAIAVHPHLRARMQTYTTARDAEAQCKSLATQGDASGKPQPKKPQPKKPQPKTVVELLCWVMETLGGEAAGTIRAIRQLWLDWIDKRDNSRDAPEVRTSAPPRVTKEHRKEFRTSYETLLRHLTALQATRLSEEGIAGRAEEDKRLRDSCNKMRNAGAPGLPNEARDVMDEISAAMLALKPLYDCCDYQDRDPNNPGVCAYDQYVTYFLLLYVPSNKWKKPEMSLFVLDSVREAYSSSAIYSRIEDCMKVLETAAGEGVQYVQSWKAMESLEAKNSTNEFVKNERKRLDIWLRAITSSLLNALLEKAKKESLPDAEMTDKLCAIGAFCALVFRQQFLKPGEDGQLQFFTARMFAQAGTPLYADWMQVLYEISAEICDYLTTYDSENETGCLLIENKVLDIIRASDDYHPTDGSECPGLLDYITDSYGNPSLGTPVDVQYVWDVLSRIKQQSHVDLPFYHSDFINPKEGFCIYHSTPTIGSGKCEDPNDVLYDASGRLREILEEVADWMSVNERPRYIGRKGVPGLDLVELIATSFSSDAAVPDRAPGHTLYNLVQILCTFELCWAHPKEKKPMATAEMLSLFRLAEKVNDQRSWTWVSGGADADSDRLYAADWLLDLVRDCLSTQSKVPELTTDERVAHVLKELQSLEEEFTWSDDKRKVLREFKALPSTAELPTQLEVVVVMLIVLAFDHMCFVPKGQIFASLADLVFDPSLEDDNKTWVPGWINFIDNSLTAYDIEAAYKATQGDLAIVAAEHGQAAVDGILAIKADPTVKAIMNGSAEEGPSLADIPSQVPDPDALPQVVQLRTLIEKLASDALVNNKRKRGMSETVRDSIVSNVETAIGSIEEANKNENGKKHLRAACAALKDVVGTLKSNNKSEEATIVQCTVDELTNEADDMLDEKELESMNCDPDTGSDSETDEEEEGLEDLMFTRNLTDFFDLFNNVTKEEEEGNDADPFTLELVGAYAQQIEDMLNRAIEETTAKETENAGNMALVVTGGAGDPTVMYNTLRSGRTRGKVHKVAPTKPASERLKAKLEVLRGQRTGVSSCFKRNEAQQDITSQFTIPLRLSDEHCAKLGIVYSGQLLHVPNLEGAHSYRWLPEKNAFTTSVDQPASRAAAIKQARTILSRVAYTWFTETATNANAIHTPSDPAAEDEARDDYMKLAGEIGCLDKEDDRRYARGTDAVDGRAEAAHDRHDGQIHATQNLSNIQNVMLSLANKTPGNTTKVAKAGTCFMNIALTWEDEDDAEL